MATLQDEIEDISGCIREGRRPRPGMSYRVELGDERLSYRSAVTTDPQPTARQLIELAGLRPIEEHLVISMAPNGRLNALNLDETADLLANRVERFLIFRSDALYRFTLDGDEFIWGSPEIRGDVLKKLAKVDAAIYGVWLEVHGGEDRPVADGATAPLSPKGLERFFTGTNQTTEG
jgi:hypothetical protein